MSDDDDDEDEVEEEGGEDEEGEGANTLEDGDEVEVQGSSSTYTLSHKGNVYMCTCPAWKNQSLVIDMRTCKHLRAYLGDDAETKRVGGASPSRAASVRSSSGGASTTGKKETAPPILLAHKWETDHDPTGWWMSEKLDGIRAYWDGETFVSRLGNSFLAPDWFTADLPADTLDGELWVGRKMFSETMSIVRAGAAGQEWKQVCYVVFDAPNAKGGFEDRIAHAEKVLTRSGAPHARALAHAQCDGIDHLREELRRVESLGGEGLMLRKPGSRYEVGRSSSLLKVKTFHDTEARVIGHAPGAGRHKGRLGALVCELPSGIKFNVGTGFSDAERENPPAIGAIITFRYQELTKDGVPRFPAWVGERLDAEWPPQGAVKAKGSKPAVAAKKPAPPPAEEEDEDDDEDEDEEQAPPPKKAAAPAPAKPAKKAAPPPEPEAEEEDSFAAKLGTVVWSQKLLNDDEGKFWNIEVRGTHHIAKFGKIGSSGQMRLTDVGSATAARTDAEKRAMQKRKEGYRIVKA